VAHHPSRFRIRWQCVSTPIPLTCCREMRVLPLERERRPSL
jgi:hypothetical protein